MTYRLIPPNQPSFFCSWWFRPSDSEAPQMKLHTKQITVKDGALDLPWSSESAGDATPSRSASSDATDCTPPPANTGPVNQTPHTRGSAAQTTGVSVHELVHHYENNFGRSTSDGPDDYNKPFGLTAPSHSEDETEDIITPSQSCSQVAVCGPSQSFSQVRLPSTRAVPPHPVSTVAPRARTVVTREASPSVRPKDARSGTSASRSACESSDIPSPPPPTMGTLTGVHHDKSINDDQQRSTWSSTRNRRKTLILCMCAHAH
jgi:hypothetical protein